MNVSAGSSFPYTIQFSNSHATAYTVNSIMSGTSGFSIVNVVPSTPISIMPASNVNASMTIHVPSSSYIGNLIVLVSETGN